MYFPQNLAQKYVRKNNNNKKKLNFLIFFNFQKKNPKTKFGKKSDFFFEKIWTKKSKKISTNLKKKSEKI